MCWDKTRHIIFSSCQRRETNKCQVQNQYKSYVTHTWGIKIWNSAYTEMWDTKIWMNYGAEICFWPALYLTFKILDKLVLLNFKHIGSFSFESAKNWFFNTHTHTHTKRDSGPYRWCIMQNLASGIFLFFCFLSGLHIQAKKIDLSKDYR